jgi:hypothetical protein
VGWHLAVWVVPIGIAWERRMKPPGLDLPERGRGHMHLSVPMERHFPLLAVTHAW